MSARPLLQLIEHLSDVRQAAGGSTQLSHVKAHSAEATIESIGNRLADYQANHARQHPTQPSPHGIEQLPIHRCERHMLINDSEGKMVIDDVRAVARVRMKAMMKEKWANKPLPQSYFADADMQELGCVVLRHGSAAQQATFLHIATNTIQYHWMSDHADGSSSTLQPVRCSAGCGEALTLDHLATCQEAMCESFRQQLRTNILNLLAEVDDTQSWLRQCNHLALLELLRRLFPAPQTVDCILQWDRHPIYAMCGAFSRNEASAAIKTLGFIDKSEGQTLLRRLRLLCIDHIATFYLSRKQQALSASFPSPL